MRLRITESSHHTDLRGRRAGAGGARGLQPCLSQTPAAVPEVDLEAGDGGLAAEMNIFTFNTNLKESNSEIPTAALVLKAHL